MLAEIVKFLNGYSSLSIHLDRQKIENDQVRYDELLGKYRRLGERLREKNRSISEGYNIFEILNIKSAEVKTHTPFLINLLSPTESHAQGELFLDSFLNLFIPSEKRANFKLANNNQYAVVEESNFDDGRIDIYIHSLNRHRKFGLVIENKLFADDQPRQLERYYAYLASKKLLEDSKLMILYLTISGDDPTERSINPKLRDKLKDRNLLRCISYKKDIHSWLAECLPNVQSPVVQQLVNQYLHVIYNLK